jgi:microcin C transport system substrate-binding protein
MRFPRFSVCAGAWLALMVLPLAAWAEEIQYRHAHAYVFTPKYSADFQHFDYVNVDAPQGGRLRLSAAGGFDSFNHFSGRGRPAAGLSSSPPLFYDRLLDPSADEPSARYGLLAEGLAWADNYEWIAFKLREGAYWHDGEPITVADVIFTFETLKEHGSVATKTNLRDVIAAEQIGPREVRFANRPGGINNRNVVQHLGAMDILPKHYWESRDPGRTTTVPPLGSGPYRIADYRMARYITYARDPNYWGNDLPHMQGRFNFAEIKFDYFRDQAVMRQALKNGLFDLMIETVAKSWTMEYDMPARDAGLFRTWPMSVDTPSGLWWPVIWNLRQERFQDIRVREALWLLFDFQYVNRVLMHGYYDHARSFFQGSPMAHYGLPSEAELALLERFRPILPERVFTDEYQPPPNRGRGHNRDSVARALALFREAGWVVENGRMMHQDTGRQFRIEFIVIAPALVRSLMPYVDTLQRIGIDASARAPEQSNFLFRMRQRQFDGGMQNFTPGSLPGAGLRLQFSSIGADIDASLNWAGIRNPAVDYLMERIIHAENEEQLLAATRAFDRVMLWNFYFIPGMADTGIRHVFWDRFGIPEAQNLQRRTYYDTWWYDAVRSQRVNNGLAQLNGRHADRAE